MFCHKCGNEMPENAVFCNRCGTQVLGTDGTLATGEGRPPARNTIQLATNTNPLADPWSQMQSSSSSWPSQQLPDMSNPSSQPLFLPPSAGPVSSPTTGSWPYQQAPQWSMPAQNPPAPASVAPNAIQRLMVRIFQPSLAANALFAVTLGSVLATILGVGIMALIIAIVHGIADKTATYYTPGGFDALVYHLQMIALNSPFRDSLQLFLVAQGVGLHYQYSTTGTNVATVASIEPLHSFLVIPALLLVLGGYIAACSDFQNNVRISLLRGAAIALPYTVLLFIISLQVNGAVLNIDGVSQPSTAILTMDNLTLLLFGVLWGVLFGTLGASLKIARGHWRALFYGYLSAQRRRQLTGMIIGGLAATGSGIALSLLVFLSLVAYSTFSEPFLLQPLCYSEDWRLMASWSLAQGPLYAVNLFAFSLGAPITFINQLGSSQSCFFIAAPHATLSLFDSTLSLSAWRYLFLLLPAISLFLGGRASVAVARVRGIGPAMIQGAIIAAPFTVLMIFFTIMCTITNTYIGGQGTTSGLPAIQSAGVGALDMLLWTLLSGAVFGALGGMYQDSRMKTNVSRFLAMLASPFLLVCRPIFAFFDLITGQQQRSQRSHAREYLYTALLITLLLLLASIVAGSVLINLNAVLTLKTNQQIKDIVTILLIMLPGLLLFCAASSALATNPTVASPSPAQPFSPSPSQPFNSFPYLQGGE